MDKKNTVGGYARGYCLSMYSVVPAIFSKFFRILQSLSIDVCAGAVAGGIFARYSTGGNSGLDYYVILFLAVFSIYTMDHLLDAKRIGATAGRSRYRFHYVHFRIILFFTILSGLVALLLALYLLPQEVIYGGLLVFAGVAVHLALAQKTGALPFMKEFSVALYYTIGIWLAPVVMSRNPDILNTGINIFLFYITVLASLFVFSWMEFDEDKKDGSHSIAVHLGRKKTEKLIGAAFATGYLLVAYFIFQDITGIKTLFYWLPPLVILSTHLLIYSYPFYFYKNDRFRILGDGIFIFYGIVYWLDY